MAGFGLNRGKTGEWVRWQALNQSLRPTYTAVVLSIINDTSQVQYPNLSESLVNGSSVPVGHTALIKDGTIIGEGSALTPLNLEIQATPP
jgi:hypothetical protein